MKFQLIAIPRCLVEFAGEAMRNKRRWLGPSLVIMFAATSCSRRNAEPVKPITMEEARARLDQCAPQNAVEGDLRLAVKSVSHEPMATKVTITVAAIGEPVDFHLPVYRLSRGRWLINETGRAYLLDEECREYKLKDRKSLPGFEIPLEGRIRLKRERKFEAVLVFPRFSERSPAGMLIYDGRKLTFVTGIERR